MEEQENNLKIICQWCGATKDNHVEKYGKDQVAPDVPCMGMLSKFLPKDVTVGRPTDCTTEVVMKAMEYVSRTYPHEATKEVIPTIEGLSLHLGVARRTIYLWLEKDENVEFIHIYDQLMSKQGKETLNGGLNGDFNPVMSRLVMTKHDYSDKQDITSNGKELKTIPIAGMRIINEQEDDSTTGEGDRLQDKES